MMQVRGGKLVEHWGEVDVLGRWNSSGSSLLRFTDGVERGEPQSLLEGPEHPRCLRFPTLGEQKTGGEQNVTHADVASPCALVQKRCTTSRSTSRLPHHVQFTQDKGGVPDGQQLERLQRAWMFLIPTVKGSTVADVFMRRSYSGRFGTNRRGRGILKVERGGILGIVPPKPLYSSQDVQSGGPYGESDDQLCRRIPATSCMLKPDVMSVMDQTDDDFPRDLNRVAC